MSKIITVSDISKSYLITHEGRQGYSTLRDSISKSVKKIFSFQQSQTKNVQSANNSKEEFWALQDINFEIEQGDRLGIVGRNGAGKSTLLKILSRITEPTKGSIKIKGRVASLLEVGTGFHPELTGRENIFLNGAILGMSRGEIKKHFDAIVDFAEVEQFLDTPVKRYSSGMYMRLAFAVAAHLEPEILVVDEVLAVGDAQFQKKCLGKMEDVSRNDGRTILFVSHNMSAVQKLCSRGIFLKKGRIEFSDTIEKVVNKYLESGDAAQAIYNIAKPVNYEEIAGYANALSIENIHGNPINEIPVGRPWQVKVNFRLNKEVKHFIIALGMTNSMEVNIRTAFSDNVDLPAGDYEAIFREEQLFFAAGTYSLTLGLSSYERSIHYIENCASITISEVPDVNLDKTIVRTAGVGQILNPMNIQISKPK